MAGARGPPARAPHCGDNRIVTVEGRQHESFTATTDGHRVPYEGWLDSTLIGHIEQLDLRGENTDKGVSWLERMRADGASRRAEHGKSEQWFNAFKERVETIRFFSLQAFQDEVSKEVFEAAMDQHEDDIPEEGDWPKVMSRVTHVTALRTSKHL
ncbi:hypothetical protein CspHIS471_0700930 [Cutaneotrichosporon sp. HIS471]|nr:hypothetical protein CspHIS471_0700930 [Cutaneotrichosporon sp. HIS471]